MTLKLKSEAAEFSIKTPSLELKYDASLHQINILLSGLAKILNFLYFITY